MHGLLKRSVTELKRISSSTVDVGSNAKVCGQDRLVE
jgi:hypothetical protein